MRANSSTISHPAPSEQPIAESIAEPASEPVTEEPRQEERQEARNESQMPSIPEPSAPEAGGPPLTLLQRPGVRQLVKFCLVGASSTVIDKGSAYALMLAGKSFAPGMPWWIWTSISFCLGVSNGYFWNRRWTFQATGEGHSSAGLQYRKFLLTNTIGYVLNQGFTKLFLVLLTGGAARGADYAPIQVTLASLCAVPIVVVWNFSAAKFWTFRRSS